MAKKKELIEAILNEKGLDLESKKGKKRAKKLKGLSKEELLAKADEVKNTGKVAKDGTSGALIA